jgi:hypothetical protein
MAFKSKPVSFSRKDAKTQSDSFISLYVFARPVFLFDFFQKHPCPKPAIILVTKSCINYLL